MYIMSNCVCAQNCTAFFFRISLNSPDLHRRQAWVSFIFYHRTVCPGENMMLESHMGMMLERITV
jgi:hypothetical protein